MIAPPHRYRLICQLVGSTETSEIIFKTAFRVLADGFCTDSSLSTVPFQCHEDTYKILLITYKPKNIKI